MTSERVRLFLITAVQTIKALPKAFLLAVLVAVTLVAYYALLTYWYWLTFNCFILVCS